MKKFDRLYGMERGLGDIIYNPATKVVLGTINGGFFGRVTLTIKKDSDGGYLLLKPYKDRDGQEQVVTVGKTFPIKDRSGSIVEGLSKGTLGLLKQYSQELKKEVTLSNDCLVITTHKLKEVKPLGESGWQKIGYITGQFAIEKTDNQQQESEETDGYDASYMAGDEIPF